MGVWGYRTPIICGIKPRSRSTYMWSKGAKKITSISTEAKRFSWVPGSKYKTLIEMKD
jgi:hypothetical protein